ncbi:MAG: hypothetical protein ACJ771_10730, partial [Chloroflexota bacterium]
RVGSYPGGTATVTGRSPPTTTLASFDECGEFDGTGAVGVEAGVALGDGTSAPGCDDVVVADPPEQATTSVATRSAARVLTFVW